MFVTFMCHSCDTCDNIGHNFKWEPCNDLRGAQGERFAVGAIVVEFMLSVVYVLCYLIGT
jgi:hypothetical protein